LKESAIHRRRLPGLVPLLVVGLPLLALASAGCSTRSLAHLSSGSRRDASVDTRRPDLPDTAPMLVAPDTALVRSEDTAAADTAPPAPGPDTAPPPPAEDAAADGPLLAGKVAFVVGDLNLGAGDAAIQKRLTGRGLEVVLFRDVQAAGLDLSSVTLVFISATADSPTVGGTFRTAARPVIVSERRIYRDMGMVVAAPEGDGFTNQQTTLDIVAPVTEPLAAGLTGTATIASRPVTIGWGLPGNRALRVATIAGRADQVALFVYPAGVAMPGLTAPARRVGLFTSTTTAADLDASGWALFDAAVSWALGRAP
jgi:hypothetical protein